MSENKTGKYLKYAIGEILLVVIGILIALNLNNRSERLKSEAKVEMIFIEIMEELASDIEKTEMPMRYFALRDSLIRLVVDEKVSKKDYKKDEMQSLNSLVNWSNSVELTHYAYDALMQDINAIPLRFKSVLPDLRELYNRYKKRVDEANISLANVVTDNHKFQVNNFSWYLVRNEQEWDQQIEYRLNNFRYRNTVHQYGNAGMNNQMRLSIQYRKHAIHCYKKIAGLLDKPVDHNSFIFDEDMAVILVGEWEIVGAPDDEIVTHFLKDKRLYGKNNKFPNDSWEIYNVPEFNKIVDDDQDYATIVQKNGETILKYHNGTELRKIN